MSSEPQAPFNFTTNVISNTVESAWCAYPIDLDQDGDIDILSCSRTDDSIYWHENDGYHDFSKNHTITQTADKVWSLFAIDLDQDNDIDILASSVNDNMVRWYENDGNQGFTPITIVSNAYGPYSIFVCDIDGDDDYDLVVALRDIDTVMWYENDGNQIFTVSHPISTRADGVVFVFAIDFDQDGDFDVLSASADNDEIAWYENEKGDGSSFTEIVITDDADHAFSVYAIDMDDDNDLDVLSASRYDHKIAWYENKMGNGKSFANHTIDEDANFANSVYAIDMDDDDDIDVLAAAMGDNSIHWYENDGFQSFTKYTINNNVQGAASVVAIDMDADGDFDVVSSSYVDNRINWYQNLMTPRPYCAGVLDISYPFEKAECIEYRSAKRENIWQSTYTNTSVINERMLLTGQFFEDTSYNCDAYAEIVFDYLQLGLIVGERYYHGNYNYLQKIKLTNSSSNRCDSIETCKEQDDTTITDQKLDFSRLKNAVMFIKGSYLGVDQKFFIHGYHHNWTQANASCNSLKYSFSGYDENSYYDMNQLVDYRTAYNGWLLVDVTNEILSQYNHSNGELNLIYSSGIGVERPIQFYTSESQFPPSLVLEFE